MPLLTNFLVIVALCVLFAAGLRTPLGHRRWRIAVQLLGALLAFGVVVLANVVSYRNDQHFDITIEEAFTPAAETLQVLHSLKQDVELIYFYQAQNPAGRAAKQMVEIMGKVTPHLKVRTIDPDQQPAQANQYGMRMYNVALMMAEGRRIEVVTTEDREMAMGMLRLLRSDKRPVCFLSGHGEYDIDNFEYHTHFEAAGGHAHDAAGQGLVDMTQHGIGRLRRALDKLGYEVRKLSLATGQSGAGEGVPTDCAALVEANPRTALSPPEVAVLAGYMAGGGNLLLLLEPDYALGDELAALLAQAGVRVGDGVVSDPLSHYFTDDQMVAVEKYASHPSTGGLALSFFPGVRPLQAVAAEGVKSSVLFASSAQATLTTRDSSLRLDASARVPGTRALAIVSEGQLAGTGKPFRMAVVGDADFASNSFYPYLANADLVLGLTAWLRGEPRGPAIKPPVEVLPTVVMTGSQMQIIFLLCVLVLPGLCGLAGLAVWWRRRQ
ncbi:Gldg family protein [Rhodoferax sp.]|uniref:GldG family protein n=1 Tax=Rhodoferax sp. TaxID=50421 RepID=UPI001EB23EEC|nr:Gldg family protein [Rhodoferax sp.]MBT9508188.1 Gldg family protein [Rhodoferax sp.]